MKATASGRYPYVEIFSTLDTGLATTDLRELKGYPTALRIEARETEDVLRQNSCRYLSRRPDTDEKELTREPQLPVIRRPAIPTVLPPNQPAEVPVADVPVVPSEVNNLPLRSRYGRIYKPPIRYDA